MLDVFTITTLEQLRAIADPLRLRLLECFELQNCTTKQAATQLGESPNKLYHHVEKLEKAGLIALQYTKPNRGTLEKYYRAVARQFVVDHALLHASQAEIGDGNDLFNVALNTLEKGLAEARAHSEHFQLAALSQASAPFLIAGNLKIRTSPERFEALVQQWQEWLSACQNADSDDGAQTYSLTFAFFPLIKPSTST